MGLCGTCVGLPCHWTWVLLVLYVIQSSLVLEVKCVDNEEFKDHVRIKRKATPRDSQLWTGGIIPYVITEPLASHFVTKEAILESIQTLQKDTCIQFRDVEDEDPASVGKVVRFVQARGCHSSVGKTGSKDFQLVSIGTTCGYPQMVLHELGHLVGLVHEHSRPDRDAHIMINWSNIKPDMAYNFDKLGTDIRLLTPYDLSSFMHYGLKVFSHNKMYNSIMPMKNDLSFLVGYRPDLSFYDKYTINTLYQCAADCPYYSPVCENEGFLDKTCQCVCPRLFTGERCESVVTDKDCGGVEYVTNHTTVITPNWPGHYKNQQSCVWHFKTSPDQVLEAVFEDFDLETGSYGICRDQLEIRAHYIGLDRGKAYCGEVLNETIISTTNNLILNFQSNPSVTRRGFKAIIRTHPKTDCSSSPCQNGGICETMENYRDYYCKCQGHWIGKNCDMAVLNGAFSEWGEWTFCTAACGLQSRHRECNNPAPQNGGTKCTGHTMETRRCQPKSINCSEQYICDYELGNMCYGMWIAGDKKMAWRTHIGGTPSTKTGPSQGHLGLNDGYLFMESSNGRPNDKTVLWLPSTRWKSSVYCVQFFYHMYGATTGKLQVLRKRPKSIDPQVLWQKSNDHGNQWIEANINVLLYDQTELGFEATKGNGYYSDIAIDDISLSPGACKLPRDSYAKGTSEEQGCHFEDTFYKNVGPVTHIKNGCTKMSCFCNPDGQMDCPDSEGEDICGDTIVKKPKKLFKYVHPSKRKHRKTQQLDRGSSGSVSDTSINLVSASGTRANKKQSRRRKYRPRKVIRLGSSKRKTLRLIGSGEAD